MMVKNDELPIFLEKKLLRSKFFKKNTLKENKFYEELLIENKYDLIINCDSSITLYQKNILLIKLIKIIKILLIQQY